MTDGSGSFEERLRAAQARQDGSKPVPASAGATPSPIGIGVRVGV